MHFPLIGALRDLKDYQIYKEVMETAMLRLQNQLEVVILQNQELKAAKSHEERQIQRQRRYCANCICLCVQIKHFFRISTCCGG